MELCLGTRTIPLAPEAMVAKERNILAPPGCSHFEVGDEGRQELSLGTGVAKVRREISSGTVK
ncbi:MAG TPA: hypothetical protein VL485_29015 [Ktedonobacteraceae bacterium]|nr:hypothetical protein [Ktedonobacteraceae bacterium]